MKTYSMTGFGRVEQEVAGVKVVVEIKSLNSSKGSEISIKTPHSYKSKEMEIRTLVIAALDRGKIDVYISEKSNNSAGTSFNFPQINHYVSVLKQLEQENNIPPSNNYLEIALKLPECLSTEESKVDQDNWRLVSDVLQQALGQIEISRLQEGAKLEHDLITQINVIQTHFKAAILADPPRLEAIKKRIYEKLQEVLEAGKLDLGRLEQELVYYSEKIDISEEKTRLKAHLEYFVETLNTPGFKGKKLGFITQELGREINTMGSKANDVTIQKQVVGMKEALEKIKEQLANVL